MCGGGCGVGVVGGGVVRWCGGAVVRGGGVVRGAGGRVVGWSGGGDVVCEASTKHRTTTTPRVAPRRACERALCGPQRGITPEHAWSAHTRDRVRVT